MLGRMGDEKDVAAVSALTNALSDPDAGVRLQVVRSLERFAKVGSVDVVAALSRGTEDQDAKVRTACVATLQAFAATMPVAVAKALIDVIRAPGVQDADRMVRAINGLQGCGTDAASEAVEPLAAAAGDARSLPAVRLAACETLEWMGQDARGAADILLGVALSRGEKHGGTELRVAAVRALIQAVDLPAMLAGRPLSEDDRRGILLLLRQLGPDGRDARRRLEAEWQGEVAPVASTPSADVVADFVGRPEAGPVSSLGVRHRRREEDPHGAAWPDS